MSRCSRKVYAFVLLSNHLHLVLKTLEPNLARGMQGFLSRTPTHGLVGTTSAAMPSSAGTALS